jgi:hypothetical protein
LCRLRQPSARRSSVPRESSHSPLLHADAAVSSARHRNPAGLAPLYLFLSQWSTDAHRPRRVDQLAPHGRSVLLKHSCDCDTCLTISTNLFLSCLAPCFLFASQFYFFTAAPVFLKRIESVILVQWLLKLGYRQCFASAN